MVKCCATVIASGGRSNCERMSHPVIGWERDPPNLADMLRSFWPTDTRYNRLRRYIAGPLRIIIATDEGVVTIPWVGDIPMEVDLVAGKWVPAT